MDGALYLDSTEVRLFECPLCLEILRGQIFQCRHGHLMCSTCEKNYSKCPTCQTSLSEKIRNVAMEDLALKILRECPNWLLGCKALCKVADIRAHLHNECAFEEKHLCGIIGLECSEVVKLIDWKKHLEKHGIVTIQGSQALIQQCVPACKSPTEPIPTVTFKPVCLMAFDAAFVFETQMGSTKNRAAWRVRSIGLQRPGDYYYKLKVLYSQLSANEKDYPLLIHKGMIFDVSSGQSDISHFKFYPTSAEIFFKVEVKVKTWNDRVKSDAVAPPLVHNIPLTSVAAVKLTRTRSATGNGKQSPIVSPLIE